MFSFIPEISYCADNMKNLLVDINYVKTLKTNAIISSSDHNKQRASISE